MLNKTYKNILFDLDGTLADTSEGVIKSVLYALTRLEIPIKDDVDHKKFIGPPLDISFRKYYNMSDELIDEAIFLYRERYRPYGVYEAVLIPGMEELLINLKNAGKTLCVATSKPLTQAETMLDHLGISKYFDHISGAVIEREIYDKIGVLNLLLEMDEKMDKDSSILIGDTQYDGIGAKKFGIDFLGVTYGFGDEKSIAGEGALALAANTREIERLILGR